MTPHEQLPASYLASCEKFFKSLSAKQRAASIDKKFKSFKHQASSFKHQASSIKHQASSIKHQAPAGLPEVEKKIKKHLTPTKSYYIR